MLEKKGDQIYMLSKNTKKGTENRQNPTAEVRKKITFLSNQTSKSNYNFNYLCTSYHLPLYHI